MVHVAVPASQWPDPTGSRRDVAGFGGPRLGLIVSKAVGNAVIRHRVARRLRAGFTQVMSELPTDALVVVRARPSTAGISSAECARQLRDALASKRIRRALEPVSL